MKVAKFSVKIADPESIADIESGAWPGRLFARRMEKEIHRAGDRCSWLRDPDVTFEGIEDDSASHGEAGEHMMELCMRCDQPWAAHTGPQASCPEAECPGFVAEIDALRDDDE